MASSKTASSKKVGRLVASRRKELAALDDEFFAAVVGVAQAIDALRAALKQVSAALDARQYEKASALGYKEAASEFVFLQRTLGGLQGACLEKEGFVQDLAFVAALSLRGRPARRSTPCLHPPAQSIESNAWRTGRRRLRGSVLRSRR